MKLTDRQKKFLAMGLIYLLLFGPPILIGWFWGSDVLMKIFLAWYLIAMLGIFWIKLRQFFHF